MSCNMLSAAPRCPQSAESARRMGVRMRRRPGATALAAAPAARILAALLCLLAATCATGQPSANLSTSNITDTSATLVLSVPAGASYTSVATVAVVPQSLGVPDSYTYSLTTCFLNSGDATQTSWSTQNVLGCDRTAPISPGSSANVTMTGLSPGSSYKFLVLAQTPEVRHRAGDVMSKRGCMYP